VWVGGGRRGDGIVIAANRVAKKFGVKTGMACFEAQRLCPRGILCRPHYDEYRAISKKMFRVLEQYSPTLVPISIDDGFLDFTTMDSVIWRNTTPEKIREGNLRPDNARGEDSRVRRPRQFLAPRQAGDGCGQARLHRNQSR
jgi:nucleotidyltransferase/DNA polymerase involved in DNA repair